MTKDEAIRILKNTAWLGSEEDLEAIETAIETLDNPWVPCSERLPEIEREGQRRGWYLTTNEYGVVNESKYEFYDEPFGIGWDMDMEIIAWMPLPEAYKKSNERQCTVASANIESYGESY